MTIVTLFSSQTTNGNSSSFVPVGDNSGNPTRLDIFGEFDGASVQLKFLKFGGTPATDADWYSTGDTAFTTAGSCFFEAVNSNLPYRLTLSNAGASTNIGAVAYNSQSN